MPHNRRTAHDAHHDVPHDLPHDLPHDAGYGAGYGARDDSGELHSVHAPYAPECAPDGASGDAPGCPRPHTGPSRWQNALLGPLLCTAGMAVTLTTLLTGCGDKTPPGEEVTMRACRICHGADRICADIGKLDRAGWEKTVDRMIAGGASVTPEERVAVIDWLATRKPGDKPLCP